MNPQTNTRTCFHQSWVKYAVAVIGQITRYKKFVRECEMESQRDIKVVCCVIYNALTGTAIEFAT